MITLTRKTDYALISLTHLAQNPEACSSAREIAELYNMPLPLLMNVLKLLTASGFITSVRGPKGGYTLAQKPEDITLSETIRAIEGPVKLVRCAAVPLDGEPKDPRYADDQDARTCDRMHLCPVRTSIHRVHCKLVKFLDDFTLADIVKAPDEGGCAEGTGAVAEVRGD